MALRSVRGTQYRLEHPMVWVGFLSGFLGERIVQATPTIGDADGSGGRAVPEHFHARFTSFEAEESPPDLGNSGGVWFTGITDPAMGGQAGPGSGCGNRPVNVEGLF